MFSVTCLILSPSLQELSFTNMNMKRREEKENCEKQVNRIKNGGKETVQRRFGSFPIEHNIDSKL